MCGALKKKILFVLGGPGAGKGTQCARLVEKYGFVHLSAGDLLREERQSGSENGELIDRMIKEGQIVPVQITLSLLQQAMIVSGRELFLIDGFPRNFDNLQGWQEQMPDEDYHVEGVLFYDCPENVMEERLLERGKTSGRTDDNAEAIRKRFRTYIESTMPVIDYYAKLNKVFKVDATPGPDAVFEATRAIHVVYPPIQLPGTMSFEENVTAFYMAFAEQQLEQMCQSLGNMRLVVQNDAAQHDERLAAAPTSDADDTQLAQEIAVRQEMLRACELKAQSLGDAAVQQLAKACAAADDIDLVLSCFYVCVELQHATQAAVAPFTATVARIFETQARAVVARVAASKASAPVNEHGYIERTFYVEALSEVLTGATDLMNAVADVTTDTAILQRVLSPLHETCSTVALEIVELYAVDARMSAWERRAIDQARRLPGDSADGDEGAAVEADESLQMIDLFLDELAFVLRLLTSYGAFTRSLCAALDCGGRSAFARKSQELNGVYLLLERFYVFQSVHKATEIAEVQELERGVFVSSMVEDVSFVLHKAVFRASQSMNYHTALSVVSAVVDALESTYLDAVVNLPRRTFTVPVLDLEAKAASASGADDNGGESDGDGGVSFSDLLLQAVDEDLTRSAQEEAKLILAINSAFLSGEFVATLEAKIQELADSTFPDDAPLLECLPKPLRELRDTFRGIVAHEIQEVLTRGIRRHLEPRVHRVVAERLEFTLTPAQYDACGVQSSALHRLLESDVLRNPLLRRYEAALCAAPFEELVVLLVTDLTQWLEAALVRSRKPFNDLGALQLERELSATLQRVSELAPNASLRGTFTRLFHVALLLNLLQPEDVVDYADSLAADLSTSEIETFLRLRVDFDATAISRALHRLQDALTAKESTP
ncbi:hypothetical protein ATCC90586_000277 [Pythium insidiosum]|nr:hypothetical protein ATCC90586_000277 [Pythium insidiosum]